MKEKGYHFALIFLAVIFQTTILPRFNILLLPNLPLIFVCIFALFRGSKEGFIWGLVAGFFYDIYSFGSNIFTLPLIGFCVGVMEGKFYKSNYLFPPIVIFFASLANGLITYLVSEELLFNLSFATSFFKIILPVALLDGLFGGALYFIFFRLECTLFKYFKDDSYASTRTL